MAAAIALISWGLIWRSAVDWDRDVRRTTGLLCTALLGCTLMFPVAVDLFSGTGRYRSRNLPCMLAVMVPVMAWGGWMIATMLLWRFREVRLPERVEQCLRCSSCGYSLRGLYGTRCPECGEEPTLDELIAGALGANDA